MNDSQLIAELARRVENNPALFRSIVFVCMDALAQGERIARERASDMEAAAYAALTIATHPGRLGPKFRDSLQGLFMNKIDKWRGRTSLNWDGILDKPTSTPAEDEG